jgi:GT2 family glycosyltransferase
VAHAPVLAFCDSDCLPEPGWLVEGLTALEGTDIVAGDVTFVPPIQPTVWSLLTIDMFLDQERSVRLSRAVTANLFVRRRDFARWGPFDESLASGGDFAFVLGAVDQGARLAYASRAIVRHPTLDDQRAFLRKIWRTSRWAAIRRTRAGWRPQLASVATLVPVLGVALARRHALRSAGSLERSRLRAAGLTPSWWSGARALFVLYAWVGWVATLARLCGWLEARRPATESGSGAAEHDSKGREGFTRSRARRA